MAGCQVPYPVLGAKLPSFYEPCLLGHERVHFFPSALHTHTQTDPTSRQPRDTLHFQRLFLRPVSLPLLCDLCSLLLLHPCPSL